jgi:hypothetical protein
MTQRNVDLMAALTVRGLPSTGRKAELAGRLRQHATACAKAKSKAAPQPAHCDR